MQELRTVQTEGFYYGSSRHEIQLAPIKLDPLYVKAFYSGEEDTNSECTLNTTAWD